MQSAAQQNLNLVVLHYHLNRGGVTSVIRNQLEALAEKTPIQRVLILHGKGADGWPDRLDYSSRYPQQLEFREIPGLGYDRSKIADGALLETIRQVILEFGFTPVDTLLQVHNHNLGKNNRLMATLPRLADLGFPLLLQVHDFPEDMRPDNYLEIQEFCQANDLDSDHLTFPTNSRIHFAFLNNRDLSLIEGKYAKKSHCHLLPNPVSSRPVPKEENEQVRSALDCLPDEKLIIYPVRAIRRKNVAEAMLLAASQPNVRVAVTLPAVSKDELGQYEKLKLAAREANLPIVFEAGQKEFEFEALISAADFVLTTSIAEGFGMVFLESWCWGKHLIGRNLPTITKDFVDSGVELGSLYEHLKIPFAWIELETELSRQQKLMDKVLGQFQVESDERILLEVESSQGWIDFAKLTLHSQLEVIGRVQNEEASRRELLNLNPRFRVPNHDSDLVNRNAIAVKTNYSEPAFRNRFLVMLENIMSTCRSGENTSDAEAAGDLDRAGLLESFLDPKNFVPLRVEK